MSDAKVSPFPKLHDAAEPPFACPFCGIHWDDSEGKPYFEAAPAKDVPLVGWSYSCRSCGRAGFITVAGDKEALPDDQV